MNKATENKGDIILHNSNRYHRCCGLLERAPFGVEQHGHPERKCHVLERVVRKGLSVEVVDPEALTIRGICVGEVSWRGEEGSTQHDMVAGFTQGL